MSLKKEFVTKTCLSSDFFQSMWRIIITVLLVDMGNQKLSASDSTVESSLAKAKFD